VAWNTALASAYGYGGVYRPYPQEVLQQQPTRRQLAVFQPPPALVDYLRQQQMKWWPHAMDAPDATVPILNSLRAFQILPVTRALLAIQPTPWSIEQANWAAIGRMDQVVYLVQMGYVIPPTPPVPLTLPPPWLLEQKNWAAIGRLDPVVYLIQTATLPPPQPPVSFPFLGQWQPSGPAIDDAYYSFRLRLLPVGPPPLPPVMPWQIELANWASIGRLDPVVYLIQPAYLPPAGPPITFPKLGQWTPTTIPLDLAFYSFRLRLLPVGPPSVAFPKLGDWPKGIMDAAIPWAAFWFKLPQLPPPPPQPLVQPWTAEQLNLAAYLRTYWKDNWAALTQRLPHLKFARGPLPCVIVPVFTPEGVTSVGFTPDGTVVVPVITTQGPVSVGFTAAGAIIVGFLGETVTPTMFRDVCNQLLDEP
jgi:hypothetical protein